MSANYNKGKVTEGQNPEEDLLEQKHFDDFILMNFGDGNKNTAS